MFHHPSIMIRNYEFTLYLLVNMLDVTKFLVDAELLKNISMHTYISICNISMYTCIIKV